jgi:hypothetical protein
MKSLYEDDFFSNLAKNYKGKGCILHSYATDIDYYMPKINQLQRMWNSLPENVQESAEFFNDLHSNKDGQFRGGVAELISAWVLSNYFNDVHTGFEIGNQKPDFIAYSKRHSYIFETYCIGKTYDEIKKDKAMLKLHEELDEVESNYCVWIEGAPKPNNAGNFQGMKVIFSEFLDNLNEDTDEMFELSHNGASFSFSTKRYEEKFKGISGWIGGVSSDNRSDKLKDKFISKKNKYFYPHTQICVADSALDLSQDRVVKALIGNTAIQFDRNNLEYSQTVNSQDSLWGIKNPNLAKNLHVQGVLIIAQRHLDSCEFELLISLAQNYHLKSGLDIIFKDVPDIFSQDGYQPLVLKP